MSEEQVPQDQPLPNTELPHPEAPPIPPPEPQYECLTIFHLTEGRKYQNTMIVSLSMIENVRQGMLKSLEGARDNAIVSIQGSSKCPFDFSLLPCKNVIYFEFKVVKLIEMKKVENK